MTRGLAVALLTGVLALESRADGALAALARDDGARVRRAGPRNRARCRSRVASRSPARAAARLDAVIATLSVARKT